jgi:hypothetical protein
VTWKATTRGAQANEILSSNHSHRSELMTLQERNEYRERQRHYSAGEGLEEFQAQHREEMRKRALAIGLVIEEAQ